MSSIDRGSLSDATATTGETGLISGASSWHLARVHCPLCIDASGRGGFGLWMGPENHFPGATAIGLSSSNSLALTMPTMDSLSEKVSIFSLSYIGGEILYSLVERSIHLGVLSFNTAQLQGTPSIPLEK